MKTFVIIKAPRISDAILAANQRGIVLSEEGMRFHKPSLHHTGEVHAFASAAYADSVRWWFQKSCEKPSAETGDCLWFSEPRDFGQHSKTLR
jgi:hypothetical protein